jgi:folate-binding protein YgfZ
VSDIRTQYRIIATGAGRTVRSGVGRLRFDGKDALSFLQALVSNDVAALAPGQGVYATYLTPQGRMISDLRVYHRGSHLLAAVPAAIAGRLLSTFDAVIFAEDVSVTDVSAGTAQIAVVGGQAASIIARACSIDEGALRALAPLAQLDMADGFVARTDDPGPPAFELFVQASALDRVGAELGRAGAEPISPEVMEAIRIESGRPAFGMDMTEETIPLEAGLLDRAISTTKGCYVGQEIIIRVLHRGGGRVAKRLSRLELDPSVSEPPEAGAVLTADGREVGKVTSSAFSPTRERIVALGYVHRDLAEAGRHVSVATSAGQVDAVIVGLAG